MGGRAIEGPNIIWYAICFVIIWGYLFYQQNKNFDGRSWKINCKTIAFAPFSELCDFNGPTLKRPISGHNHRRNAKLYGNTE